MNLRTSPSPSVDLQTYLSAICGREGSAKLNAYGIHV